MNHDHRVSIDIDVKERPVLQGGRTWHDFLHNFLRRNDKVPLADYVRSFQGLELETRKRNVEGVSLGLATDEFNQV